MKLAAMLCKRKNIANQSHLGQACEKGSIFLYFYVAKLFLVDLKFGIGRQQEEQESVQS